MLPKELTERLPRIAEALSDITAEDESPLRPSFRKRILHFLDLVRGAMYPKIFGGEAGVHRADQLALAARELEFLLLETVEDAAARDRILLSFFEELPRTAEILRTDVRAAYEGDPAARSYEEIMLTYPAFEAISIFRIAHILFALNVPLIPRMMTEYAHKNTGIDIHPGATVGSYFFIDHGTGVVIGETCRIGAHVKLYQGVTLGAKSFELDENGNPVKGIKRHPDIGDHVVVYANATILGGKTSVGDHAVIGGSVWLTHSVPAGTTLYYQKDK